MRISPIAIPLVIKNATIVGPAGSVKVDLLFDTGAAFIALSRSILKVVGYDPAIVLSARRLSRLMVSSKFRSCESRV